MAHWLSLVQLPDVARARHTLFWSEMNSQNRPGPHHASFMQGPSSCDRGVHAGVARRMLQKDPAAHGTPGWHGDPEGVGVTQVLGHAFGEKMQTPEAQLSCE
jgi:hypothetical protein